MTRKPLPNRRIHETIRFQHWGMKFIAGLGRANANSPISEVFLNTGKTGEQSETLARDSAVLLSLALQHGVPLETIGHALTRNADGSPSGPIGALVDLVGKSI
jgi:hypothetical protein